MFPTDLVKRIAINCKQTQNYKFLFISRSINSVCTNCNKKGHFSKVCLSLKKVSLNYQVDLFCTKENTNLQIHESLSETIKLLPQLLARKNPPMMIHLLMSM